MFELFGSEKDRRRIRKQVKVLILLSTDQPLSVQRLVREIGDKDCIIIRRLEELGLIELVEHPNFYPLKVAFLTEKGEKVVKAFSIMAARL